jgi:hypothetical protein
MVHQFYEHLFSSEPCDSVDAVLDSIPTKVTDDMNADLCNPYTDEEIEAALFQMGPTKASGPDGFPALFYQTHWEFFKSEICNVVRSFLCGGEIPEGLCDSIIALCLCDRSDAPFSCSCSPRSVAAPNWTALFTIRPFSPILINTHARYRPLCLSRLLLWPVRLFPFYFHDKLRVCF